MASDTQRYYLCSVENEEGKQDLLVIFSNQKNLLTALEASNINLQECYITGSRKNLPVTAGNISRSLTGINLSIYREDKVFIRILVMTMNKTNPMFLK